jgi:hypothetical protein
MIRKGLESERAAALWGVFGAPLVGVPIMVGLLTLSSGAGGEPAIELEGDHAVEQVELREADRVPVPSLLRRD